MADLIVGWKYWLDYALAAGAVSRTERDVLACRAWTALQQAGAAQAEHLAAAEPCGQFLRLLTGALASGRAHCATPQGDPPAQADAWGWRGTEISVQDVPATRWNPLGRCVGWIDGTDLYLEPEAAYAEAQEMARHQGESLSVSVRVLWKRMDERHLLASRDTVRERMTVRRRLAGQERRQVIHLRTDTLYAPPPAPPSPAPPKHGENGDDFGDGCTGSTANRPQQPSPEPQDSGEGNLPGHSRDGRDGDCDNHPTGGAFFPPPSRGTPSRGGKLYSGDGPYGEGF
jgi:hypothetical protein